MHVQWMKMSTLVLLSAPSKGGKAGNRPMNTLSMEKREGDNTWNGLDGGTVLKD